MQIKKELYDLLAAVAAQVDYGVVNGDRHCLLAAADHAAKALKMMNQKTAEEEREEERQEERRKRR